MNRALTAFVLFLAAACAAAQAQGDSGTKVRVKRAIREEGSVVLDLRIEPSWHIYAVNADGTVGNATKVLLEKPYEIAGRVTEPQPSHHKKDYLDETTKEVIYTEEYDSHEGEITLRIPFKGSGSGTVKGSLEVTACDANVCLQSGKVTFRAEPASAPGGAAESRTAATTGDGPASRIGNSGPSDPPAPPPAPAPESRKTDRKVVKDPKRIGKFAPDDPFQVVEISYPDPITSDRFDVTVVAEIKPEFHVYGFTKAVAITGIPTTFTLMAPPGASPAIVLKTRGLPTSDPAPKRQKKQFEDYEYLEGRVTFVVPARAKWAAGKPPESGTEVAFTSRLAIDYQTCTANFCLLPGIAEYDIAANAPTSLAISADDPAPEPGPGTGAEGVRSASAVDAKLSFEPAVLEPNSTAKLVARLRRLDGKPIGIANAEPRIALAQGQNLFIEGPTTATAESDGSVTLRAPIRIGADAPEAAVHVAGRASLGGLTGEFAGDVNVVAPLLGFLLIAIASAFGALLTPCVFPMIPVTMSFFTKQAETGQQHPAKLATIYCIGIVASFTAIGALFTLLVSGSAANEFAGHWITQLVITGLFVFFALSLLGMFDLSVPQPIMNMVERSTTRRMEFVAQGRGISLAVLMMGLLFSVTTFTCTAPFIGGLLAGASASGYTRPIVGMFAFSLALAIPFFFLALFPSQLKKLPKAGGWLNETKVVMGFIELAAAVKFVASADLALKWGMFTRNVCLAIWIALHALMGLYLIGVFRMPKDMPRQKTGVIPVLLALTFLTIAIYLTTGLNGKPLAKFVEGWLPPIEDQYSRADVLGISDGGGPATAAASGAKTGWPNRFDDDFDGALKEAKDRDLPLFVDFTGWSCANCRAVEATIFMSSRDVRKQLEDFVIASLHLDGADSAVRDKHSALEAKFITKSAMPYYVVVDPKTMTVVHSWGWENADPAKWKPLLKDALERWKTLKQK